MTTRHDLCQTPECHRLGDHHHAKVCHPACPCRAPSGLVPDRTPNKAPQAPHGRPETPSERRALLRRLHLERYPGMTRKGPKPQ